jgi:hypothetical protein
MGEFVTKMHLYDFNRFVESATLPGEGHQTADGKLLQKFLGK